MIKASECECKCHKNIEKVDHSPCCRWDTNEEILEDLPNRMGTDVVEEFKSLPYKDLISWHHGLGTFIRNRYRLWERKWEPEVRDGVDYSPNHPDSLSQRIIEEFHKKLNGV